MLREQSKEMRVRRRQRAEEQAQKVPVKITFPLILCLFPALLVVIMGPGIIEISHSLFRHCRSHGGNRVWRAAGSTSAGCSWSRRLQ